MYFIHFHNHQAQNFSNIASGLLANVMNNATIINTTDNGSITDIKTQHRQIMRTITYEILKFQLPVKNQQWQIIHSLLSLLLATWIPLSISTLS